MAAAAALTLAHLPATIARLQALRGLKTEALIAARFDEALDELEAEAAALEKIDEVRNSIIDLSDGLDMLVLMLENLEEERLRAGGLCSLLAPLAARIGTLSSALEEQLPHMLEIRAVAQKRAAA